MNTLLGVVIESQKLIYANMRKADEGFVQGLFARNATVLKRLLEMDIWLDLYVLHKEREIEIVLSKPEYQGDFI